MRLLLAELPGVEVAPGAHLDDAEIDALYADPGPLLRLNFVATLDGAATGGDGVSGSINSEADHRGFAAMRRAADVLLVGAGTVRAENYGPGTTPMVVVSGRASLPPSVRDAGVVLATSHSSGAVEGEKVWLCGQDDVDLAQVVQRARQGFGPHVLCEGGPSLAAQLVAAGLVDELGLSWTPHLVAGSQHPRIMHGPDVDATLSCRHLLEEDGTLLGLWRVER